MSILDYQQNDLSSAIWRPDHTLRVGVKQFIDSALKGFFEYTNIEGSQEFIKGILIGSSLATYYYTETSDLDVKIVISIPIFKEYNQKFKNLPDEEILERLISTGRESFWLTALVPDTLHVLDVYFISIDEANNINLLKFDSLYDVIDENWIKRPQQLMGSYSPSVILEYAKEKASKYIDGLTLDLAKTRRDTIDLMLLIDYLKGMDQDDLSNFAKDLDKLLNEVNDGIESLVSDRDLIKDLRHRAFKKEELDSELEKMMGSINYSDENLIFKVLQRYGYMRILSEIKELYEDKFLSLDEIDDLAEILHIK